MFDSCLLSMSPFISQLYCLYVLSCFSCVGSCLLVHVRFLSFNVVTFYLSVVVLVWFALFFVGEAGLITLVSLTCLSTFLRHVSFVILCVV